MHRDSSSDICDVSAMFPGFRFSPTDIELVSHYLKRKINGLELSGDVIAEVEFCKYEPWELPAKSIIQSDHEWFFFSPNGKKYPKGSQAKRGTESGFWKATGKGRDIKSEENVIGTKRTLVFYLGRAPKGTRTGWTMHEYSLTTDKDGKPQDSYVICRLRKKQEFGSHVGSSAQSSVLHCTSDVRTESQQSEMDASDKSAEDDCFADILKYDIINLDDYHLSNSITEYSAVSKSSKSVCSFKPKVQHFQGTAHRRIGLGRQRFRRGCRKMCGVHDNDFKEEVKNGDGERQSIYLTMSKKLLLLCQAWKLLAILFMVVLVLMLLLYNGAVC